MARTQILVRVFLKGHEAARMGTCSCKGLHFVSVQSPEIDSANRLAGLAAPGIVAVGDYLKAFGRPVLWQFAQLCERSKLVLLAFLLSAKHWIQQRPQAGGKWKRKDNRAYCNCGCFSQKTTSLVGRT
jgi:hypothetical protein